MASPLPNLMVQVLKANASDATVTEEAMNLLGAVVTAEASVDLQIEDLLLYFRKILSNDVDTDPFLSCVRAISSIVGKLEG